MELLIFTWKERSKDRACMSSCLAFSVLIGTDIVVTVHTKIAV